MREQTIQHVDHLGVTPQEVLSALAKSNAKLKAHRLHSNEAVTAWLGKLIKLTARVDSEDRLTSATIHSGALGMSCDVLKAMFSLIFAITPSLPVEKGVKIVSQLECFSNTCGTAAIVEAGLQYELVCSLGRPLLFTIKPVG